MKTLRMALCLAVLASVAASAATAENDAALKLDVNGLRVVAPVASDEKALAPFNWTPGTTISLLIQSPAGGLVQFDAKNSLLTKFSDEKGTDLLAQPAGEKPGTPPAGFSMFPKVSDDAKYCAVEITSPALPAKGSTQIDVEGIVAVLCASTKSEQAAKDVALRNGSKFSVPGLEFTIDNVGKPDFGAEPLALTLRAYRDLDEVAEVRFVRADGGEIKARRTSTSKMGIFGNLTVEWCYSLAEKCDVATVKVYRWTDLQKKKLPFRLSVRVGL